MAFFCWLALAAGVPAAAFPPYRSTDADTADAWTFEARLGLLRLRRDRGENFYSSPLARLNLGLPGALEIIGELEVRPDSGGLADAALGGKWVPVRAGRVSLGNETLVLLPVPGAPGAGVESQLVATYRDRAAGLRLHVNGGLFHDSRPAVTERGLRGSVLAELERGRYRPGLELFVRRQRGEPVQVLFGPGVIVRLDRFDVRLGLHFGLTAATADAVYDAWAAGAFALR